MLNTIWSREVLHRWYAVTKISRTLVEQHFMSISYESDCHNYVFCKALTEFCKLTIEMCIYRSVTKSNNFFVQFSLKIWPSWNWQTTWRQHSRFLLSVSHHHFVLICWLLDFNSVDISILYITLVRFIFLAYVVREYPCLSRTSTC